MSQKQKGWKDKILDKAANKLSRLTRKYMHQIDPEDDPLLFEENEARDKKYSDDLFSKAKGGKIVASYYKGGKI
jgi:hypothetical protein|tara:strand:+ start:792 stop:1013 length:222 start_codon:yes stop_codon:yes gene_type:complete